MSKEDKRGFIPNNSDKHSAQWGFYIGRFAVIFYAREYCKYRSYFLIPGVSIDFISGFDYCLDLEIKILFFGLGFRFCIGKKIIQK